MTACQQCGKEFTPRRRSQTHCSRRCAAATGSMVAAAVTTRALSVRFWEKVAKAGPGDCWEWTAATRNGYGTIGLGGKGGGCEYAHRLSALWAHGPCPDGMEVMHSCDNRRCVNPAHLSYGTRAENMEDMTRKGRRWPHPRKPRPRCPLCGSEASLGSVYCSRKCGAIGREQHKKVPS